MNSLVLIHHCTKEQIAHLAQIFGKLVYSIHDEQTLKVPEWIKVMWEHAK